MSALDEFRLWYACTLHAALSRLDRSCRREVVVIGGASAAVEGHHVWVEIDGEPRCRRCGMVREME
jgi:hypothetical protein